ncbi:MAG TPA: hypothetical protein VK939_08465 [Longimicrobiales bacterium]|nr:hypothetical protein [Longimicrobiales bacterium]
MRAALVAVLLLIAGAAATRAVSVSPMSLFLDHRTRAGSMTLYNPNPHPEEIEISFAYGYPQSDSAGEVTVPLVAVAPAGEPAATPWLRAFPRRLVLQPGQQQVVRVLAQPPADLPDGEYWSRVLVTAVGGQPAVEQQVRPDVSVAITMRTIVVGSLNYRKGTLTTSAIVTGSDARATGDGVQLTLDLERGGSAAWLGRVRLRLEAADGRVLAEQEDVLSIYRTLRRRFTFPLASAADARGARVRYVLETERPELGQANLIAAPAVEGVVAVSE